MRQLPLSEYLPAEDGPAPAVRAGRKVVLERGLRRQPAEREGLAAEEAVLAAVGVPSEAGTAQLDRQPAGDEAVPSGHVPAVVVVGGGGE